MEYLQSPKNERIKQAKKLQVKKYQQKTQRYLLEDWHLVEEAIASGAEIKAIFATERYSEERALRPYYDQIVEISPEVAQALSDVKTSQGIFAEVTLPQVQLPTDWAGQWLLLDAIQDPGNVGTLVRTADAAGVSGVIFGRGCADLYNPKVLRAMQGSQFHLPIYQANLAEIIPSIEAAKVPVYGSELNDQAKNFREITGGGDFALIMGNEGQGMSTQLLNLTNANLYIPINGHAESLNVGVAAGVLLFQLTAK